MSTNLADKLKHNVEGRSFGKKLVGYLILGALALVFVFFGYTGKMGGGLGYSSVGRVNDTLISVADFQQAEGQIRQYYANMFGGAIDLDAQKTMLRQQALENLLHTELVSQAAHDAGIYSTDGEVRRFILEIPAFQEDGRFQRDRYNGYLEATRMTAGEFENRVRKDIANVRTRQLVEAASRPSKLETDKLKELRERRLNLDFVRLEADDLARGIAVPEAEAKAQLADAEFAKKAEAFFEANKAEWSRPETVTAQHILIATKPGDASSEAPALEKAKSLRARAAKEDFGKLAAQFSEDPGSKSKQGRLEPFSRGRMVKEFEDAAFAMKAGEISEPVKSPFGYHLIKVTAKDPGVDPSFDQVKLKVAQRLLAREKADALIKEAETCAQNGDAACVDRSLKLMNAKWDQTGEFDLASDSVPRLPPAVAPAAFEVSEQKPLLNRAIRDGGALYLVKFKSSRIEAPKTADPEDTVAILQRKRADAIHNGWVNEYRAASKVEVNPEVLRQ